MEKVSENPTSFNKLGVVVLASNSSYSGGGSRRIMVQGHQGKKQETLG
jgi:hypothetical protein